MTIATKYKTYPKYKSSGIDWLGDIPEGWEVKKLKYGFYFTKGKNAALYTAEYNAEHAGDYPVYSGQTEGEGVMGLIDSYDYDFEKVIFTTTVGAKVMTPLLLSGKFSLSQNCLLMIKSSRQVFEKYFYYQLFPLFDREKSLVPSHMQPSLRFSDLNTFDVAYPEIDEQKEIVVFLDRETAKIDGVVEKKQKMIELFKEKRQALITHAVTKGLDPKEKMKPSGIDWLGDIPEVWDVKRLRFVIKTNPSKQEIKVNSPEIEVSFIPMEAVSEEGEIDLSTTKMVEEVIDGYTYFRNGDVVIAKITPCFENGKGAIMKNLTNGFGFGTTEFHVLRSADIDSKYLYLITRIYPFRAFGEVNMKGAAGQKRVPEDFIKDFSLGLPKIDEQKEIIDFLDHEMAKIDEVVNKIETQIEKLQEYRQALIASVVTGKIMVN